MSFLTIPIRTNSQTFIVSWVNLLRTAGIAVETNASIFSKFTFTHTQLQAASLTNDIEIFSLATQEMITAVVMKHSVAFVGTGITAYDVSVGIASDTDKISGPFDVIQSIGDTIFLATSLNNIESFGGATSIRLAAVAVGANLDQSTAGSVDIWIQKTTLP